MLLITDSKQNEDVCRQLLADCGLRVHLNCVRTVQEAARLLKSAPSEAVPGVIVLDQGGLGSDPTELLLWLQNRQEFKRVVVLVLAECADPEAVTRAYGLGATAVLAKPPGKPGLEMVYRAVCALVAEMRAGRARSGDYR